MPSLLNELLDPKQVVLELRATNESQAILEIVELLRANGKVEEYYKFSDAVMEREGEVPRTQVMVWRFLMPVQIWSRKWCSELAAAKRCAFRRSEKTGASDFPRRRSETNGERLPRLCRSAGASRERQSHSGKGPQSWNGQGINRAAAERVPSARINRAALDRGVTSIFSRAARVRDRGHGVHLLSGCRCRT